jgi:truncated hemoglobin YjbI
VISLVERLQTDPKLEKFFSSTFEADNLFIHQQEFLKTIFANKEEGVDVNTLALLRYYYSLVNQGFNETHFDLVVRHFMESMDNAWIENQDVIKDALQQLGSFRVIFTQETQQMAYGQGSDCKSTVTVS